MIAGRVVASKISARTGNKLSGIVDLDNSGFAINNFPFFSVYTYCDNNWNSVRQFKWVSKIYVVMEK